MITKEEVRHIAKLARLGLAEKEVKKMQKELSAILDYFKKLKEVDMSKAEITSHSIKIENVTREDDVKEAESETSKKILNLAPEIEKGYFKVKQILLKN